MAKCGACGRYTASADSIKCTKCDILYHRQCVKIPQDAKLAASWSCPGCKAKTPRKDNSEHPVRGEMADYISCRDVQQGDKTDELLRLVKELSAEMKSFRHEFIKMREEITALRTTVDSVDQRVSAAENKLVTMESQLAEVRSAPDKAELISTIERLKDEVNDRDQNVYQNDIEITGVQESEGENVDHLVSLIIGKLGTTYDERDFVFVERVGVRRGLSSDDKQTVARPRPIVVRCARRRLRDTLLQSARVRRNLTTEGLDLAGPQTRFYMNERLTRLNKALFFKVREETKRQGWRYAWTKNGRIFVRREPGKASFRVRSEDDLQKIFGRNSVGSRPSQV